MSFLRSGPLSMFKKLPSKQAENDRERYSTTRLKKRFSRSSVLGLFRPRDKSRLPFTIEDEDEAIIQQEISDIKQKIEVHAVNSNSTVLRLDSLPYDTLLMIFMFLDIDDAFSLSQVSRNLHEVSTSTLIWRYQLSDLFYRKANLLAMDYFCDASDLTSSELRQLARRSVLLNRNWGSHRPKIIQPVKTTSLSLAVRAFIATEWFFISDPYLIMPSFDTHLVCWDIEKDERAGHFELLEGSKLVFMCSEPESKSLYTIFRSSAEQKSKTRLQIGRIDFPHLTPSKNVEFVPLAEFFVPSSYHLFKLILDAERRAVYVLYKVSHQKVLRLYVVFDWSDEDSVDVDTGVVFNYGETIVDIWFSEDHDEVTIYSEYHGLCLEKSWSVPELRKLLISPRLRNSGGSSSFTPIGKNSPLGKPTSKAFSMAVTGLQRPGSDVPQSPLPERFSLDTFRWLGGALFRTDGPRADPLHRSYVTTYADRTQTPVKWTLVQYYVPACDCQRNNIRKHVIPLEDPVTLRYGSSTGSNGFIQPVVDYAFGQIIWIDQIEVPDKSLSDSNAALVPRRKKKVVKLVMLPDIDNSDPKAVAEPVILEDIPEEVLDTACHLMIQPSMGAILIPTEKNGKNELHRFQYA